MRCTRTPYELRVSVWNLIVRDRYAADREGRVPRTRSFRYELGMLRYVVPCERIPRVDERPNGTVEPYWYVTCVDASESQPYAVHTHTPPGDVWKQRRVVVTRNHVFASVFCTFVWISRRKQKPKRARAATDFTSFERVRFVVLSRHRWNCYATNNNNNNPSTRFRTWPYPKKCVHNSSVRHKNKIINRQ